MFGAAGAPKNFDPIFNDDGESFRPARQMYDTLITYKPGSAELEPAAGREVVVQHRTARCGRSTCARA